MIGMNPQRRGLFGSGMGAQFGASMPQGMGIQENPMAAMAPEQPKQRWMDGGKFGTKDAIGLALGAIGDAFTGRPMTSQMILGARQDRRQQEQALAAEQRAMQNQRDLIRFREQTQAEFAPKPEGPKPGSFEWYQTATPEQRAAYDAYNPVITTTYQGPTIVPRSSLGGGAPSAPVGRLTPISPTIENTPPPGLNANGMPASLTRAQYEAVVQRMGREATEAWARRNNIQVSN